MSDIIVFGLEELSTLFAKIQDLCKDDTMQACIQQYKIRDESESNSIRLIVYGNTQIKKEFKFGTFEMISPLRAAVDELGWYGHPHHLVLGNYEGEDNCIYFSESNVAIDDCYCGTYELYNNVWIEQIKDAGINCLFKHLKG